MSLWIPITLIAAFAQAIRFVLQKVLRGGALSTGGATFARFVYSAPLAALVMALYMVLQGATFPGIGGWFFAYALTGGLAQIVATMCVVALFQRRNFAVGMTFKNTEVLQAAIIGFVILGDGVTWAALGAILIGLLGVLMLSEQPVQSGQSGRFLNRASALGLVSGVLFGVSAVGYRAASLEVVSDDSFLRAAITLSFVTLAQALSMAVWLRLREASEITRVFRAWRVAGLVGVTSMVGSLCWFWAFTLQNAAYVKALGQVELIFSFAASIYLFGERATGREIWGIGLLCLSVVLIVLAI